MLLAHTNQKSEKGGCVLKRLLSLLLCAVLLLYPVHAAEQPKYLALTFDDGPSGVYTERLLNGLAQRQVHATFFLCGYRIEQYPQITQRIAEDGHEIGMHGDQHRFFTEMSPSEGCDDLSAATQKLAEAAQHRQVICVTHLAPVAACAAHHYRIYKTVEEGRTFTRVEELGHEDRVRELARIMVGDHITESALQSAGEMLAARA